MLLALLTIDVLLPLLETELFEGFVNVDEEGGSLLLPPPPPAAAENVAFFVKGISVVVVMGFEL